MNHNMSNQQLVKEFSDKCEREGSTLVQPPQSQQMVSLVSLLTEHDMPKFRNLVSLFLEVDQKIYNVHAHPSTLVPQQSRVIRDEEQILVGISAVSGG